MPKPKTTTSEEREDPKLTAREQVELSGILNEIKKSHIEGMQDLIRFIITDRRTQAAKVRNQTLQEVSDAIAHKVQVLTVQGIDRVRDGQYVRVDNLEKALQSVRDKGGEVEV